MSTPTRERVSGRALYELQRDLLSDAGDDAGVPDLERYSLGNQLLIAYQFPTASEVAGFREWLKRGRCVRKGERGIGILAPSFTPRVDDDGVEHVSRFYRTVFVFDVSQTDPVN